MQENINDPLGILSSKDPLSILKKKDGGTPTTSGPSPSALQRLDELKKQLKENQLAPQRTELPKQVKQAKEKAEFVQAQEQRTPKVAQMMVYSKPTFKVEYPEQEELTAKVLGFQNAQQKVQFEQEDKEKQQQKSQQAADEFYNTGTGKLYYNFFKPLADAGARAIGNTGATVSRLAGEDELAEAIVKRFTPEKRYEGTIAGTKPTKLQGGLFNDGKMDLAKLPSTIVRGLTDMAWLIAPAGITGRAGQAAGLTERVAQGAGLVGTSFLQTREDYYQEGKNAGLKGDALDNFATGAAGLTSALEAVFPNTIALGGFKTKLAKDYAKQIASGITTKAALKAGVKEILKEAVVKEPAQEITQLVGDKVARTLTDMVTGENNFGDQFDWDKSKDELYETLVITPIISTFAAGSGAIRNYTPTNYEKALFYDASKNAQQVNQYLDNKFIENEITEDQYKEAKQKFSNYNNAVSQVKNLGYSEDQTLQMAWELFSGKEKMPSTQAVTSDPILKDALGSEIKRDKEIISENIRSIGMGVPNVGAEMDGKEVSYVISNIGDKGTEIGQSLVDQISDDKYRVEEVSVNDLYNNDQEFKQYVDSYKKGSIAADAMLVPAVIKDGKIVDGRARLAEQYLSGKNNVKIFKNISDATNESQVQEGRAEGDIGQPQGTLQGQPEVGQGEGSQGQTQITPANVGDSNIGSEGQVVAPELSNIESVTPEQKKEVIRQKFDFITDQDFVQESFTQEEDIADRSTLPDSGFANEQEFKNFLETGEYAMLTGQNPEAIPVSKEANKKLNDRAKEWLSDRGLRAIPIFGKYGNSERSFMVPDMTKSQAIEFAKDFSQDSVAHSTGLVFKDGSFNPRQDGVVIDNLFDKGEDNFSSINISGSPVDFKISFDFDTTIPSDAAEKSTMVEELLNDVFNTPIEKARQSLSPTGVDIQVVSDPAEYDAQVEQLGGQRGTEGVFLSNEGKILLNEQKLKEGVFAGRIIWHEASHPVMNIVRNTNPDLYNRVLSGLKQVDNPAVKQAIQWANENYEGQGTIDDESIVETVAMVADGTLDLDAVPTGLKQSIIDFINLLARALGFNQVLNDTDVAAFKKLAGQIADALTSGRNIGEVVGRENVKEYGVPVGVPTQAKVADKYGPKVKHDGGTYKLSFVKPSDIIDIKGLIKEIADSGQKVWFWTADQLGRGMYYDNVIEGEHYLDAGPSFALDPKNRDNGVIWATGKGEKWVNDKIANSDYIFIISGSPQKSKLFNKRVAEITFNRVKKSVGEEGAWDKFKSEVLGVSKIGKINEILNKYNSFEDLLASTDRKELLIQFDAQKEKKGTPLKGLLEKYGAFVDYNDLRDGFFKDNDFKLNDVMLVLKPTGYGGKSAHSTYENDILGEVVGVPDRKVNAYDIMPDEFRAKYAPDMSRTEQSQAVAPYGAGVRSIQASAGGRDLTGNINKKLTDDGQGNYVFFHYSGKKLNKIDPSKFGANLATGRDERPGVGISMYYVDNKTLETGVSSDFGYAVRIPKDKVYPFNEDPLNFYDQAKVEFEKDYPGQSFDANKQIGYITKVANDNGFDITVADWNIKGRKALRAQTTKSLKPEVYKQKVFKNGSEREQYNEELQKLKPGVQASVGNREIINGFYSPIEDRINTFKQPKASVQKWKEIVGVKSDEAVFSGMSDWLGGKKPDQQLSKEEVLQFMKDNRIEINEVMKGDEKFSFSDEKLKEMDALLEEEGFLEFDTIEQVRGQIREEKDFAKNWKVQNPRLVDLINEYRNSVSDFRKVATKFSQYQLPGGENYKEVLITLPGKDQFKSSHFDETNIITHLRMNTRTDADGKKVLFLEEVQSDWGQTGKRVGFDDVNRDKLLDKENQLRKSIWNHVNGKYQDIAENITLNEFINSKNAESWFYIENYTESDSILDRLWEDLKLTKSQIGNIKKISPAPYVTNTNAWVKLGLKVALKEAVRQGADRIAWTTGEQQNERYDLSKQVDEITYRKLEDGNYRIIAYKDLNAVERKDVPESGLEAAFGKDVAERIINGVGDFNQSTGITSLTGLNLSVGGKGMKAFYGDAQTPGIVANVAKALVKELTGKEGAIVPSRLSSARNQDVIDRYNRARQYGNVPDALAKEYEQAQGLNSEQPAIDITPELLYAVTGGMPQFSVGNRPENNPNFKLGAFVMRKKAEGATDGEIAIAIASVTGMKPEDIKTLIDNPEQYIRDMFPSMTKLQQDNLIQKAKIQNIYRGRQFGKPIDKAFTGLEVPQEYVDEYMNKTAKSDNAVKEWATDFKRKWLDPAKGLPDWVLAIKDFASGSKNIEIARASKTIERLKDEAKKIGFTDWDAFGKALVVAKDVKRYIPNEDGVVPFDAYRAAAGKMFTTPDDQLPALVPDDIKALPDEIIPYVYAMRGQIDNLTRDLIGNGYVTPEQAVNLENNIGEYVNRSYRMFNEMGYKPEPEVMNAAIKFLADDYVKKLATDKVGAVADQRIYEEAIDLAKKDVDAILNKKKNPFFNTSVDRRNTGILQQRQEISEPIRKLMGEYTDPGTVFMMTVAKQAALKASSQYLNKLRENGMGNLFFEQNDPSRPASHSVQIAAAGTESMNPLGGLYTTPEIAEAIEMAEPTYNELTQAWMKLVGAVRWGKTVGSVATQFKNFESNLGFAVLNGYLMSGQNTAAFKASAKYVKGQYSKAEIDAITDKAIRLNLVGQSVGAREIKEMLGSGDVHDIALDIALGPDGKWGKKVAKKLNVFKEANKLYRLGDDFWKVYAYMTEREQLSDARFNSKYEDLTKEQQDQIDVESSERVKNTWPTYDRVIEGAKFVSKRAPIFGNFISFQAESLRVLANSIKLAKQDIADPQLRHLGVRRAAGIAAYFGLRSAITIGLAKAAGFAAAGVLGAAFGDDEEERNKRAIKQALPPFMRTSDLAVIRTKEPHKFTVISLSSLDPYAIIPNSLNAYTEGREGIFGKTMDPGVAAATTELFSSFLEPEMTFSTMWSVVNNIDPKTKQEIVLSSDSDAQAAAKVGGKVWDMLEPSSVALVQRFFERKDKEAEILAIGGARPYDVDLHKSFGYILSQFGKDIDAINREYNSIKYREGMSQQDKDAAEMAAEDKKAFAISKLNETYKDFMNLGADPKVLNELINQRSSIKVTGFDKNTKNSIKTGKINKKTLFK